ncbi:unnamed protein product (macronuclear) [Paramecium tetraurelia]|uniref:Uncharacterized protein n=1 Tax=Paramecium tetraurelia TaxID=5888 RepID=A0DMZ6_PARTE|nr:uncharacterized protein GSPATT00018618001 [Paramecium tetraurelia]CAK84413.1 unnamed protein product [Paramecium tetraurelia]|eukprot:XP_001451810.1 hypothetical protein (macronuclear) [Paramecium tetraurelia strain d4-2]
MNKQRRQKILPIQQIQAKLKQLKQSIRASEIKSLRSSCLFTETTPNEKFDIMKPKQNHNSSVDGRTMYIKPTFKKKMKTTKRSPQSMKAKTSSIITQSKTTVSPQKHIKDILQSYIKSKFPKSRTTSKSKSPQKLKKVLSPQQRQIRSQSKKKQKQKLKTTVSPQMKKSKKQKTQVQYYQPQISKISSIRLNTFSVSEDPHKMLLNSIIEELQLMNEKQMIELQQFLRNIKQEKKDEALQTSIHEKLDMQKQHQQSAFQESLPLNIINEICHQREEGIKLRVNMQMDAFNNLLQQQKISPRSFNNNNQVLHQWQNQQTQKLHQYQEQLKNIQNVTNKIQSKTQRDLQCIQELQLNKSIVIQQLLNFIRVQLFRLIRSLIKYPKRKDIIIDVDFQPQQNEVEIQTNVGTISLFVELLCQYIIGTKIRFKLETNLNSFIKRMNYPYGLQPFSKLRQIHGYEVIEDDKYRYPIQEYIFTELQNKQNSSLYEKIHNRAIFDTFNEILNQYRPFYYCNGQPYPWEYNRNLVVILYNNENIHQLLEKAKDKLIFYASVLCGLINDDEENTEQFLNYEQVLQNLVNSDYLSQLRNERLQLCINNELQEYEYMWSYTDTTETIVEITDHIFEDLINELTLELL